MTEHDVGRTNEAQARLRRRFEAADAFAALVAYGNDQIRRDLWSHWDSPAPFAKRHPSWYQARWGFIPDADFDWWGIDTYPWFYLHACLDLAGYAVLIHPDFSGHDVSQAISQLAPVVELQHNDLELPSCDGLSPEGALRSIAECLRPSGWTLIQLRDGNWDAGYIVSAARKADIPELARLAATADVYELGIIDLTADAATRS